MFLAKEYKEIVDKIYSSYLAKGFVCEDEALSLISIYDVSIKDTELLTGYLLSLGVIFSDNTSQADDDFNDYGFSNYDKIYNEIVKIDDNLSYFVNYLRKIKPPQRNEFSNLILQARNGNAFARTRIIEMNLRVAVRQALYFYKKYNYDLCDSIQDASEGLVIAYTKYDVYKSLKFPTHITWWIRQSLYKNVIITDELLRCPFHIREKLFKVYHLYKNKSQRYKNKHKGQLIQQTIKELECSELKADRIFNLFNDFITIDYINKRTDVLFSDCGKFEENIQKSITNELLSEKLLYILNTIPNNEKYVIGCRFGINSQKYMTLNTLSKKLGVTRERVRQIEVKALRRLKHPTRCKYLTGFFEIDVSLPSDRELPENQKFIKK